MKYMTMKYQVKYWARLASGQRNVAHGREMAEWSFHLWELSRGIWLWRNGALNLQRRTEGAGLLKSTDSWSWPAWVCRRLGEEGNHLPRGGTCGMEGRLFCPDSESKRWEGELLPWRPDSREKGNKDHRKLSLDTEGKVRSAHREDRTAARKMQRGPALWSKARKDRGLLETGPPSSWAESSRRAAGR